MKAPFCLFLFAVTFASLPASAELTDLASLQARAAKGDAEAELDLGRMYHLGKGVPVDYAKAAELYRQAAAQGNAKAMYNLGYIYSHAQGVPQDNAPANQWFQKSADAGLPAGQLEIGEGYYYGDEGLPKDYAAAKKWLTLAANQKDAPVQAGVASNLMGLTFENGLGEPLDMEQARTWYAKGAEYGNVKAQSNLGRIYMEGGSVKQNPVESYKWLKLAAAQGDILALHLMPDYLHGKIYSEADMAEGERQINEYRAKHHQGPLGPIAFPMVPTLHTDPVILPAATGAPASSPGPSAAILPPAHEVPGAAASPEVKAPPAKVAAPFASPGEN